jgi:hypothetical protein
MSNEKKSKRAKKNAETQTITSADVGTLDTMNLEAAAEAQAEASREDAELDAIASEGEAPAAETPQGDFDTIVASYAKEMLDTVAIATGKAFDERASFERVKNPTNENIHKTIKKARAAMITHGAAAVMTACTVSPDTFNRVVHDGSRYNVYAMGKVADIIAAVTGAGQRNQINRAVIKSLFNFAAAGLTFTGEAAKAAASDKIRFADVSARKHLVSHTVSASTAPTQASSTMQALETLGVVKREGSSKNPTFTLTAHPIVAKLRDVFNPMPAAA